jgi:hypothetical protein
MPAHMVSTFPISSKAKVEEVLLRLCAYCRSKQWAGYDPYDALNSKVFQLLPLLNARWPRIALTQALKRSPVNIRRLALVPKTQNPKAIGLFLSALLKLPNDLVADRDHLCEYMLQRIAELRSPDRQYWSWGYSFPWQTRENVVPAHAPNLVCTTFVANALLDAYEANYSSACLDQAVSAAEYILDELYWDGDDSVAGFSYPLRSLRVQVHNANFLAAALLCRVYKLTGEQKFLGPALKVTRYSARKQEADGSWYYGERSFQQWIDNFHTGYNLCALQSISENLDTREFESCIRRGLEFYCENFFREDGAPRYFHNRTYPLDIHCVAQSIITLLTLRDVKPANTFLAQSVLRWAMKHMWDERGFFYYRVLRFIKVRTSYMRWSQAWMFLALATVLTDSSRIAQPQPADPVTTSSEK